MNILVAITLVVCGFSQIFARPSWYDNDSQEIFRRSSQDYNYEDYGHSNFLDGAFKDLFNGGPTTEEAKPFWSHAANDYYYGDNLSETFTSSAPAISSESEEDTDEGNMPTTDDASEELTTTEEIEEEEDTADEEGKYEMDDTRRGRNSTSFVFSARIGFNPEVKIELLGSDSEGHVKSVNYNFDDALSKPTDEYVVYQATDGVQMSYSSEESNEELQTYDHRNDEIMELLKPSPQLNTLMSPHPLQAKLLNQLSLSSSNSELLTNEYSDNVRNFVAIHKDLEESLDLLTKQNEQLYAEFFSSAGDHDYNGEQHKRIEAEMVALLSKVEELKGIIVQMQNVEQKRNYHLLLDALLKEIYG